MSDENTNEKGNEQDPKGNENESTNVDDKDQYKNKEQSNSSEDVIDDQDVLTKDEFNKHLRDRLKKKEDKIREEYSDYEDLKNKVSKLEEEKNSLTDISTKYENTVSELNKLKIAREYNFEDSDLKFVSGNSYEEMKSSADDLKKYLDDRISKTVKHSHSNDKQYTKGEKVASENPYQEMVRTIVEKHK